jgi:hypothetical protein
VDKNKLVAADSQRVEDAFQAKLATFASQAPEKTKLPRHSEKPEQRSQSKAIDKNALALSEPRRIRDRDHVKYVAKQACLVCGRNPSDAHHFRYAQSRALGRKVSDEFTVPLCRGHHREVHRCGDEITWWKKLGIDPSSSARALWLETHPLPTGLDKTGSDPSPNPIEKRDP